MKVSNKYYLTNGGNILVIPHKKSVFLPTFINPSGEFIRQVSDSEACYLSQVCVEIVPKDKTIWNAIYKEMAPVWKHLITVQVCQDESAYKESMSSNGGHYSFSTFEHWLIAKYPDGTWKLGYIEDCRTSSEISFTSSGHFQTDLMTLHLINCDNSFLTFLEQARWEDGIKIEDDYIVTERIIHFAKFSDLCNSIFLYIPSVYQHNNDEESYEKNALSEKDIEQLIEIMKELGVPDSFFNLKKNDTNCR